MNDSGTGTEKAVNAEMRDHAFDTQAQRPTEYAHFGGGGKAKRTLSKTKSWL